MMHRRELLLVGAGALAAKATASAIACANEAPAPEGKSAPPAKKGKTGETKEAAGKTGHEGHEGHEGHGGGGDVTSADAAHVEFASLTAACVAAGDNCLAHCLRLLGTGDNSMADCSKAVNAMLGVCKASGALAVQMNPHFKAAAKLCHDVCKDCAEACKPHEGHHPECKACMEACLKTVEAAAKFV